MSPKEDLRKTMAELYAGLQSVPANEREQWLEAVRSMAYEFQDVGLEDLSPEERREVHNMAAIRFPQAQVGFLKRLLSGTLTMG